MVFLAYTPGTSHKVSVLEFLHEITTAVPLTSWTACIGKEYPLQSPIFICLRLTLSAYSMLMYLLYNHIIFPFFLFVFIWICLSYERFSILSNGGKYNCCCFTVTVIVSVTSPRMRVLQRSEVRVTPFHRGMANLFFNVCLQRWM